MAERIATSTPKEDTLIVIREPSSWGRRIGRTFLALLVVALLIVGLVAAGVFLGRGQFNDDSVPVVGSLVDPEGPQSMVAVFAFPGDEIAAAGTLAKLDEQGVRVTVVYYADSAPTDEDSGATREQAEASTAVLGVDDVEFLDAPIGSLDPELALGLSRQLAPILADNPPAAILTTDEVGYNGSPARAAVAAAALEAVEQSETPIDTWQVVLAQPALEWAVNNAASFQGTYPVAEIGDAPKPTAAIEIDGVQAAKAQAVSQYSRGVPAVQALPYAEIVPSGFYYRALSREYFTEG